MISIYPEAETLTKCTLFADSSEAVSYFKQLGFKCVYNIQAFENDEWEIVGLQSNQLYIGADEIMEPYGRGTWITVSADEYKFSCASNVIRTAHGDYRGKYYAIFWTAPIFGSNWVEMGYNPIPREVFNTAICVVYEKDDDTRTPIGFYLKTGARNQQLNEYSYEKLWGEFVDPSPTKHELRIYKDIVLLNGAKILNEDGTEHTI